MKLFSICTPQAAALKDKWFLKTLQDDWELHIVDLDDVPQGNGDYLSREWYYCLKKKIDILIDAIKSNPDDIILFADMDIQFFRPCTDIINECMQGHDIVFQMWSKSGTDVNPGFMAIRCNDNSRAFLEAVSAVPFDGRAFADQDVINDLLKKGSPPIRWGVFPRDMYQVMLGLVPDTIALHHACATPPPCVRNGRAISSMDHKVEQLTAIRRYVESPLWGKLLSRVKELLKRILRRIANFFRFAH
jgi:hypothetical protein